MFKKILYPTDLSEVSLKAVEYIERLRESGSQEVIILHVINQRNLDALRIYGAGKIDVLQWQKEIMEKAYESLTEIVESFNDAGFEVETRVEIGVPLLEILKAEKEDDISMIVIGSHGKSNLEEMFLGSVSEKVVRKCKKPVLVVKR